MNSEQGYHLLNYEEGPGMSKACDTGVFNMGLNMKENKMDGTSVLNSKKNDIVGSTFICLEDQHLQQRRIEIWSKSFAKNRKVVLLIFCVLIIGFVTALSLFLWQITMKDSNQEIYKEKRRAQQLCHHYPKTVEFSLIRNSITKTLNLLRQKILKTFVSQDYKAISIAVVYDGDPVWMFNLGQRNSSDKSSSKVNERTLYPVASITKIITALMLQQLVSERRVTLDTSITDLEPMLSGLVPKITLRQLSCMISGLPREAPCSPAARGNLCPYNYSVMARRIALKSTIMKPDMYTSYSNLGYALLGRILAKTVAKTSFENFTMENILTPLRMYDSGFLNHDRLQRIPLSVNNDGTRSIVPKWGWIEPSGGLLMSLNDSVQLTKLFLRTDYHDFLGVTYLDEIMRPEKYTPDGTGCGCPFLSNLLRLPGKQYGYQVFQKDGVIYGYGSIFALAPDLKLGVNILTAGKTSSAYPVYSQIFPTLVSEFHERLAEIDSKRYRLPPNATQFVGNYKLDTFWPLINNPVSITLERNVLYVTMEWFKGPLSYVGDWTLETVDYSKLNVYCSMRSMGVIKEKYFFEKPTSTGGQSPGFRVDGISLSGYAHFTRNPD